MTYFLGVDGGGTGCRAALADATGRILGQGQAGSANVMTDPSGAARNIRAAAEAALADSGISLSQVHAVLGLAGATVSARIGAMLEALPFASARVVSDAVIALKGALGGQPGIVATIGTGSVFACDAGQGVRVIGGGGYVISDEASGAWLGRELLAAALRACDGIEPATPLLTTLIEEMGGQAAIVTGSLTARPTDFARHAPRLVAHPDDPAAVRILTAAEGWICRYIDHFQTGALPICFLGGLGPFFTARLTPRYGSLIRAARGTAVEGALLMAREGA